MARCRMGDIVTMSEFMQPGIGLPKGQGPTAAAVLVSRLFTDAVFNQDIRAIQLIINRIDGGLPRDVDVESFQTYFGDCLNEIMSYDKGEQLKIKPDDTVMMCLCKSLYDIAVQDIYTTDWETGERRQPSSERKKERDAAMRMVLERTGGRRTLAPVADEHEEIEIAPWIAELPKGTC